MKLHSCLIRILTLAAILPTVAVTLGQQKPQLDTADKAIERAVLETNARMTQAADRMDVDAFFEYIVDSDQCVIIQNGTVFKTRQEAVQAVQSGYAGLAKLDRQFKNPKVTVVSPDVALLASEGTVSATLSDGRHIDARFAVSLVFVLRDGKWKVLQGHYSNPPRSTQ